MERIQVRACLHERSSPRFVLVSFYRLAYSPLEVYNFNNISVGQGERRKCTDGMSRPFSSKAAQVSPAPVVLEKGPWCSEVVGRAYNISLGEVVKPGR